jgi:CheY-like chemotaxis protein
MLEHLGFTVVTASNRDDAIAALQQLSDDPLAPLPLVLLDLSDANGESAVETCRLLHTIKPELRVIAMSGTILDPVMRDCQEYGFVNALAKPYSMDSLKHVTAMVINK